MSAFFLLMNTLMRSLACLSFILTTSTLSIWGGLAALFFWSSLALGYLAEGSVYFMQIPISYTSEIAINIRNDLSG